MKQLIVIADMEGASGIFSEDRAMLLHEELFPENRLWREVGRRCITSDVRAVCEAANDFGVDEILLYDAHFAGCAEHNVILEELPKNVRVFDVKDRCFFWRRIRGQAAQAPFGVITVGSHSRNGEPYAYFPHTIQTPPISEFVLNGMSISEIASGVITFRDAPYIANIGCAASHKEARELSQNVSCISVKNLSAHYEPSPDETFPKIYDGVRAALSDYENKTCAAFDGICKCTLRLCEGYRFEQPECVSWKGFFDVDTAYFEAPDVDIALELFNYVRECIREI